jgi:hypothetical protein
LIEIPSLADLVGEEFVQMLREGSIWIPTSESRAFLIEQALIDDCDVNDDNEIISRKDKKVLEPGDERYDRIVMLAKRHARNGPYKRKELGD